MVGAGLAESGGLLVVLAVGFVALVLGPFAGVAVFLLGLSFAGLPVFLLGLSSAGVPVFLFGLSSAGALVFLSGLSSAGLLASSPGLVCSAVSGRVLFSGGLFFLGDFLGDFFFCLGSGIAELSASGGVGGGSGRATRSISNRILAA